MREKDNYGADEENSDEEEDEEEKVTAKPMGTVRKGLNENINVN